MLHILLARGLSGRRCAAFTWCEMTALKRFVYGSRCSDGPFVARGPGFVQCYQSFGQAILYHCPAEGCRRTSPWRANCERHLSDDRADRVFAASGSRSGRTGAWSPRTWPSAKRSKSSLIEAHVLTLLLGRFVTTAA